MAEQEVPRITPEELKAKVDSGENPFILDVRSPSSWESSDIQIAGAIRIPPDEVPDHLADLPTDRQIVTYCT